MNKSALTTCSSNTLFTSVDFVNSLVINYWNILNVGQSRPRFSVTFFPHSNNNYNYILSVQSI